MKISKWKKVVSDKTLICSTKFSNLYIKIEDVFSEAWVRIDEESLSVVSVAGMPKFKNSLEYSGFIFKEVINKKEKETEDYENYKFPKYNIFKSDHNVYEVMLQCDFLLRNFGVEITDLPYIE
jgi:hypothetical protein